MPSESRPYLLRTAHNYVEFSAAWAEYKYWLQTAVYGTYANTLTLYARATYPPMPVALSHALRDYERSQSWGRIGTEMIGKRSYIRQNVYAEYFTQPATPFEISLIVVPMVRHIRNYQPLHPLETNYLFLSYVRETLHLGSEIYDAYVRVLNNRDRDVRTRETDLKAAIREHLK